MDIEKIVNGIREAIARVPELYSSLRCSSCGTVREFEPTKLELVNEGVGHLRDFNGADLRWEVTGTQRRGEGWTEVAVNVDHVTMKNFVYCPDCSKRRDLA